MSHDLTAPAKLVWHFDEEEPPESWTNAAEFPTLREAMDAIVNGAPQTGHPWLLCGTRLLAPREIEDLWRESLAD
jgi:hypothetical protein